MSINARLLTVEDVNSIIAHFNRGFADYYVLDTRDLSDSFWFAYDFLDITMSTGAIDFKVNNALWTGGFYVKDCNITTPSVSCTGDTIHVAGTGLEWCVLVLELSPEFAHSSKFDLAFYPEFLPVIRPFFEDVDLVMGFLDVDTDAGVSGLTVSDLITSESLTTDSDGLVTVTSEIDKHGDYDYQLGATNNSKSVAYNFPYQRIKCELPVRLVNDTIYRDKKNTIAFEFLFDEDYSITEDMLFTDNELVLVVDNVRYPVNSFEGNGFDFVVPVGSVNLCTMKLLVGGNDYLPMSSVEFIMDVSVVTCATGSALKSELESEDSARVVLFTGDSLDTSISVSRDVLVRFTGVVSSTSDVVFNVGDDAVLSLSDCNFSGKTLVNLDDGAGLVIEDSTLQHCMGTVITGTGNVKVNGCSFIDNISCLNVKGKLTIKDCLFDLSDISYLDTGNVAFIHAYDELTLDYSEFNLNLTGLTNLGLGYVMLYLGKDSTVNGVNVANLMVNESFPVNKNVSAVDIESTHYHITNKNNKCMIWTVEDTNTVYSNNMEVEYNV